MTHEPECLEVGYELDPSEFCSICITARAAYQCGREDAAKAVEATMLSELDEPLTEYELAYVAAARGDGDQA